MRRTSLCVAILLIAAGRRGTDARDGRHGHAPRPGRRVSHGQPDRVPMRGLHDGRTVIVEGTMKPATATIFLALLLTACAPAPAPAPSPRIVFMSMRDGNWEIYLMNVDGSKQINLTNHPEQDMSPACSRDGRRIAFESGRDGNQEIYAMKDDGSDQTRLTNSPQSDQWPARTPDGRIGYCSDRDTEPVVPQLFIMDADGQDQARLLDDDYSQADAAWSPDGARIAFDSMQNGRLGIYVMNADGSGLTCLTNCSGPVAEPTVLPDGTLEIIVGPDRRQDAVPSWSPDGRRIVYESLRGDNFEVYVMNADGSGEINLTNHPAYDGAPAWSRDGSRIAFVSDRDGSMDIYVMNADGSGVTRLTANAEGNLAPEWCP